MREAVCVVVPSHAPYTNYVGSDADYGPIYFLLIEPN
jgi:hypothetical protein